MKKTLLIALLIIAACAAPTEEPQVCCKALTASCLACSEDVSVEQYCADNPGTVGCDEPAEVIEPEAPEPEMTFDEPTQALVEKGMTTTNYNFLHATLPENKAQNKYYIRGDKVRVELYTPATRAENSYDVVYLDLSEERAVAYCEQGNPTVCPDDTAVVARPDFDDYSIELPHQLISRLDNGELVGSVTYDGHVSDLVNAELNGEYVKLTINRYYGIPMRVLAYTDATYTGEPGGEENRDFAFNTVTEEQVTPPSGW